MKMLAFFIVKRNYNFFRNIATRLVLSQNTSVSISHDTLLQSHKKQNFISGKNGNYFGTVYEYPAVDESVQDDVSHAKTKAVENRYAHSVMVRTKSYRETLANIPVIDRNCIGEIELDELLTQDWRLASIPELKKSFREISYHVHEHQEDLYSNKYADILESLSSRCREFNDFELCHVMQSLMLWLAVVREQDTPISNFYSALDNECKLRAPKWQTKKLLLILDHWYRLRFMKESEFVTLAMLRLGQNVKALKAVELVQYMFYMSVDRINLANCRDLEMQLKNIVNELTVEEVALVALGFFKSQTKIRDRELLRAIILKAIHHIESIDDISLAAILKIARYSIGPKDLSLLCKLFERIIPQIPRLSLQCLTHTALAAVNKRIFQEDLMNAISTRFYQDISSLRLKDIRSLVFALSSFNYIPEKQPNIFDKIVEELSDSNRKKELKDHPQHLALCLHHLSMLNIHPKNLIEQVLDSESIREAYGLDANAIRREIFALDVNVEVEFPDYVGPRLDEKLREDVAMKLTDKLPPWEGFKHSMMNYFMHDVIRICEAYLGSRDMLHVDHILPQYGRADIIICLDEANTPVPIGSIFSELPVGNVKHPPKIDINGAKWLALIIGTIHSYALDTDRPLGHICAKRRQLEHIGYEPTVIFWQDWMSLENDMDKFKYLQDKVF
ncbi:FAST kinase domain-containing protein 5, mitochondrial-like [Athalia rosae]|uniref:FAST kinase domain-containing protein 5, mitochondrial-like n=1 Tax=Athalia rosae TaxID=37344 RepID=UPI0020344BF3|nr:FAST kinase domain-containing protein 5, mitochondrial-like [Athalia rosae]